MTVEVTFFVSHLSWVTVSHCLMFTALESIVSYILAMFLVVLVEREKLSSVIPLWLEPEPFDTEKTSQSPQEKEGCTVSFLLALLFHSLGPPDSPPFPRVNEKLVPKMQILRGAVADRPSLLWSSAVSKKFPPMGILL